MNDWKIVDASIDWLTATAPAGEDAEQLLTYGTEKISEYVQQGHDGRRCNAEGYSGIQSGPLFVGTRRDGAMFRHSHGCSEDTAVSAIRLARHISRIDVQVSARNPGCTSGLCTSLFGNARVPRVRKGRQPECTLIQAKSGGETLYVGRRVSPVYFRIYNKAQEDPEHYLPGTWRWEVEVKRYAATPLAGYLAGHNCRSSEIQRIVPQLYARVLPDPLPFEEEASAAWQIAQPEPDAETRIRWLGTSVRSAIHKLQDFYTRGEIVAALGLELELDAEVGEGE